ncbi:FAD/NAD(P)-binding domain-containing protein [Astrocystis sublimbata]|nr:FAD/NAD(P)-binding domain-containing protein [Astrocystis sublimbata]
MEYFSVAIIGAGLHGLAAARTLVNASSDEPVNLIILDEGRSIGGTWSLERLYPGLKTNNVVGSYEFSDFPMDLERYGLLPGQHIPGRVIHQYLADFATHFCLDKFVRHQSKVNIALLREDGTWELEYKCDYEKGPAQTRRLRCDRLVVATGLTSAASMPTFQGTIDFQGPLFHAKDLRERSQDLKDCREVVVVGGNKSAWDVCYSVAIDGARAHMVIRPSGGGPSWVWRPICFLGLRFSLAGLSSTRLFSWFDPGPFGSSFPWIRRFLHRTIVGTWITRAFWTALDSLAAAATGYNDPLLRMLRPWASTFWIGNSLSIHNYETDWFDLVREGRIVIHHADIVSLGEITANLSDGSNLRADAVICCTGWKPAPPIRFKPDGIVEEIGLPREVAKPQQDHDQNDKRDQDTWDQAHAQIKIEYPQLKLPPRRSLPADRGRGSSLRFNPTTPHATNLREKPYHLHRFLVPASPRFLELRNLAFIGMLRSIHGVVVAQAQALWITAFFGNRLPRSLDFGRVYYETILYAEYERLRRPKESGGSGANFPDLVFDSIPYVDLLLEDLGLETMRKTTLWDNISQPHLPADYR